MRRIEKRGVVNVLCDDDGNGCMPATRAEIEFFDEIERLRAEVEALRADAERWEHARSIACFTEDRDMGPGGWWTVAVHVKRRPAANTIDAAVDAARAAQGERG